MEIYSLEKREALRKAAVRKRVRMLIPHFMRENEIEMWIVAGGDGQAEPVLDHLIEDRALSKTILVFFCRNDTFLTYRNYRFRPEEKDPLYAQFLRPGETPDNGLERLIRELDPKNIAVNISENFSAIDALTHTMYGKIAAAAGDIPVISAEPLSMDVMQIRLDEELEHYEKAAAIARELIAEVLNSGFVAPGITTTADIRWHMRERMSELGLPYTWGPNVNMQREGSDELMIGGEEGCEVILPGDLLHVDFGFSYLSLDTDMQYLAYVRKPGETEAPAGLTAGFEQCRRFQELYMQTMAVGKTGNEIRRELMAEAEAEGMNAMVYSHPIGRFVHGVGPCIGRFGMNEDIIPCGEYIIKDHTCYAMEQNVRIPVPEWGGQTVYIFREEDIKVVNGKAEVIGSLQPYLWLI